MATSQASDLLSRSKHMGEYGDGNTIKGKVTLAALATGDIVRPLIIPAGFEVHEILVANDQLDSNGAPTAVFRLGFTVKDSTEGALASVDNFFGPAGQAQVSAANEGKVFGRFDAKKFEQDVFLDLLFNTGAATFAAGSVWVTVKGRNVGVK